MKLRLTIILASLLYFPVAGHAQNVYTITADSVKLTSCDSSELIIENHTQAIPGFLFNTGRGRTIFKRGLLSIGNNNYLIGADTLKFPNAWVQGGNAFGATGVLGTTDTNMLDLYQHNTIRMRFFKSGNVAINSQTDPGNKLYVNGSIRADGGAVLFDPLSFDADSTADHVYANTLTFNTNNALPNNRFGVFTFTNQPPDSNSGTGPYRLIRVNKLVNRGSLDGEETGIRVEFTVTGSASDLRALDAASGNVAIETGNLVLGPPTGSTSKIDVTGTNGFNQLRLRTHYTPSSSSDSNGNPGDTAVDDNYFYYKTSSGWKRVALNTF